METNNITENLVIDSSVETVQAPADSSASKVLYPKESKIRKWLGLNSQAVDDILIPANESYLRTLYTGNAETDAVRLKNFMTEVTHLMEYKRSHQSYVCCIRVPDDLLLYLHDIEEKYRSLGYFVANLRENIEDVDRDYLFISWDKFDINKPV